MENAFLNVRLQGQSPISLIQSMNVCTRMQLATLAVRLRCGQTPLTTPAQRFAQTTITQTKLNTFVYQHVLWELLLMTWIDFANRTVLQIPSSIDWI